MIGLGALTAVAQVADLDDVAEALRRADKGWIPLCLAGLAVSYAGYVAAYHDFARARGGPTLGYWTVARIVTVGFGANALGSSTAGLALDYWAIRRGGASVHDAGRRVLAFNTMEWAVLGGLAALSGALALVGVGDAPASIALPWLIAVPACTAGALWVSAPRRADRLQAPSRVAEDGPRDEHGRARVIGALRRAFADAVGGLVLIRHMVHHPHRYPGGVFGYVAYWGGHLLILDAALASFGEALDPVTLLLTFTTGYAATALPLPAGGAGGVDVSLALVLGLGGVPLAVAVLAVFLYRVFTFWLPIVPALLMLPAVRRLARDLPEEGRRGLVSQPSP